MHYPIENSLGCQPFKEEHFNHEHLKEASLDGHKPIILVDRGTCTFVTKAKNIQAFGGILAVIADNVEFESPSRLIMSDDGTGSAVKIPSFLISNTDGKMIKEAIHTAEQELTNNTWGNSSMSSSDPNNYHSFERHNRHWSDHQSREGYKRSGHQVIMEGEINIATKTKDPIQVDIWYSSLYELMQTGWDYEHFARMEESFDKMVHFQPRSVFKTCHGCKGVEKQCILNGKYCPYIPYDVSRQ